MTDPNYWYKMSINYGTECSNCNDKIKELENIEEKLECLKIERTNTTTVTDN